MSPWPRASKSRSSSCLFWFIPTPSLHVCVSFSAAWRWCCCGRPATSSRPPTSWWTRAPLSSGFAVRCRSWSTWPSCCRSSSTARTPGPNWAEHGRHASPSRQELLRNIIKSSDRRRRDNKITKQNKTKSVWSFFQCRAKNKRHPPRASYTIQRCLGRTTDTNSALPLNFWARAASSCSQSYVCAFIEPLLELLSAMDFELCWQLTDSISASHWNSPAGC